jgi:hypothetical protein
MTIEFQRATEAVVADPFNNRITFREPTEKPAA